MATARNEFLDTTWETLKENGRLLTVFASLAIIISGLTLIQAPSKWWIALLAVTGFFLALFLFLNARVVIKVIFASVLTVVLSAVAFNVAIISEPLGSASLLWFLGHYVVFFFCLSVSYFLPSGQSRWTTIAVAIAVYFGLTWFLAITLNSLFWPAILCILIAAGAFVLLYLFGGRSRFSGKTMPKHMSTETLSENILKAAALSDFNVREISSEDNSFLLWGDRAYVIYPIEMEQALGVTGRKKRIQLSYRGKAINSWLRFLSFTKNPYFRTRGAESMLVLLDMKNANGTEFKTIGVSMPDSRAITPVGIMPGKLLLATEEKALKKAFSHLDSSFESFSRDLTEKQKTSLAKIGVKAEKKQKSK